MPLMRSLGNEFVPQFELSTARKDKTGEDQSLDVAEKSENHEQTKNIFCEITIVDNREKKTSCPIRIGTAKRPTFHTA